MLWNDDLLNAVNVLFFWSVVGLNVFGLMVTQVLGSVFRAVMLTARTASVSCCSMRRALVPRMFHSKQTEHVL